MAKCYLLLLILIVCGEVPLRSTCTSNLHAIPMLSPIHPYYPYLAPCIHMYSIRTQGASKIHMYYCAPHPPYHSSILYPCLAPCIRMHCICTQGASAIHMHYCALHPPYHSSILYSYLAPCIHMHTIHTQGASAIHMYFDFAQLPFAKIPRMVSGCGNPAFISDRASFDEHVSHTASSYETVTDS